MPCRVTSAFRRRAVGGLHPPMTYVFHVNASPVPFGGEPWADIHNPWTYTYGDVTSAFRRRAVGGPLSQDCIAAIPVESPVPFGGEPWADAEAWGEFNEAFFMSPVPFGGEPWADRKARLGPHRSRIRSHQCLSAESRGRTGAHRHASTGAPRHQCLSAESRGRTGESCKIGPVTLRHQCLSAESRGRTEARRTERLGYNLSPVPFGGEPWADDSRSAKRNGTYLSPVPFGGEPWADVPRLHRLRPGCLVTSAFRRRAVGGRGCLVTGLPAPGHQCLSAESRGRTAVSQATI